MALPKQKDVEIPLLRVLSDLGGKAKPKEVYPLVAKAFGLTVEEQEERMESSPATRKWWNLVQWVRQSLIEMGEIDGTTRGIWQLTSSGKKRLETTEGRSKEPPTTTDVTLRDLFNENSALIKKRIIDELNNLSPHAFEKFCLTLLQHLGYVKLTVTGKSKDGGIDGFGDFRQGVVRIKSAFQAKKWKENPVGRPEIDKFRGSIQGDYDHGVFITTNRFTRDAEEASIKKGAISILLLDGDGVAETMIERGIGVRKQHIYLYDIDEEFFDFETE